MNVFTKKSNSLIKNDNNDIILNKTDLQKEGEKNET